MKPYLHMRSECIIVIVFYISKSQQYNSFHYPVNLAGLSVLYFKKAVFAVPFHHNLHADTFGAMLTDNVMGLPENTWVLIKHQAILHGQ